MMPRIFHSQLHKASSSNELLSYKKVFHVQKVVRGRYFQIIFFFQKKVVRYFHFYKLSMYFFAFCFLEVGPG